ncbi:hypothetical protein V6N13_118122 [Hibiscus sabdariffa]
MIQGGDSAANNSYSLFLEVPLQNLTFDGNFFPSPFFVSVEHINDALIEQIKSLVHRHPDKLTVETIGAGNKGYKSEITVVTYCHSRKGSDDKSKFRILLIIHCLPEFWAAWTGAYHI